MKHKFLTKDEIEENRNSMCEYRDMVDAFIADIEELRAVLWLVRAEQNYCPLCLCEETCEEDERSDEDAYANCKPDCRLANALKETK